MRRRIMISVIATALLFAISCFFLINKKTNIDLVAKKLVKSNSTATIKIIEPGEDITKPSRIIWVIIGEEIINLYEYKDKDSAEYAMAVMSDGPSGASYSIAASKENIVVCYRGQNQDIIKQFKGLLD